MSESIGKLSMYYTVDFKPFLPSLIMSVFKFYRILLNFRQLVWGEGYCERVAGVPAISGFEAMDLLLKEKVAQRNSREGHSTEMVVARTDDRLNTLVYKLMVHQVHVLGEGYVISTLALVKFCMFVVLCSKLVDPL